MEARPLCRGINPKDTPFIALTLVLEGWLWTSDEGPKVGLPRMGFDRLWESKLAVAAA
jgi:predicted nucleic acid-binding protein